MATPSTSKYTLSGTITQAGSTHLPSLTIAAFDCDLRREEKLGETQTDRQGKYALSYTAKQFTRAEKASADLLIRVFDAQGKELAASGIHFNAGIEAEINLELPAGTVGALSEWQYIATVLKPLVQGIPFHELEEDASHRDLSFLSGEAGFPLEQLRRFVLAQRLGKMAALPAELWYALFCREVLPGAAGLPDENLAAHSARILTMVPGISVDLFQRNLSQASKSGLIPALSPETLAKWTEEWTKLGVQTMERAGHHANILAELSGLRGKKRQAFLKTFQQNQQQMNGEFLAVLKNEGTLSDRELAALQENFLAAQLTDHHFALLEHLRGGKKTLDLPGLARNSAEDWAALLEQVPEQTARGVDAAALQPPLTGEYLAARFRAAFPTQAFSGDLARRLSNQTRSLAQDQKLPLQFGDRILQFLTDNPDFEWTDASKPLAEWLQQPSRAKKTASAAKSKTTADDDAFLDELKAVQRVFRLTPNLDATLELLADGLHSGQQIYLLGENQFADRFANKPGFTESSAREAWQKAAQLHASVVEWLGEVRAGQNAQLVKALRTAPDALATRGLELPDYQTLFTSTDVRVCEHCKSVYSPAAYLADVLLFLQYRKKEGAPSALDELKKRRPDLAFLEFTCDNSNVPLPYIDLVNEVLEEAVAPTTASAASLRQTRGKTDDLVARPQYVNQAAYTLLNQAVYPASLPFDLNGEELGLYLQKNGIQRWELMGNFRKLYPDFPGSWEDIACAYFGIAVSKASSIDEKRLVLKAEPTAAQQARFWGANATSDPKWLSRVAKVNEFLDITGLDYEQMLVLLDLEFINPGLKMKIALDGGDQAIGNTKLQSITNLDAAALDRIHRFLRLWRKTGLKLWELDLLIKHPSFGAGSLGEKNPAYWETASGFLAQLMQGLELKKRLGIDVEQLCALFGPIPTRSKYTQTGKARELSLFHQLFMNPRRFHPVAAAFQAVASGSELRWRDHLPALMASLGLKSKDFAALTVIAKVNAVESWKLKEFSALYRHYILAQSLGLSFQEWGTLSNLVNPMFVLMTGEAQYVSYQNNIVETVFTHAGGALEWLGKLQNLTQTGFSVPELAFLLLPDEPQEKHPASAKNAKVWMDELRRELMAINTQYSIEQLPWSENPEPSPAERTNIRQQLETLLSEATTGWLAWTEADSALLLETLRNLELTGSFDALKNEEKRFLLTRLQFFRSPLNQVNLTTAPPQNYNAAKLWGKQLSYDALTKTLTLQGVLLKEEYVELMTLSDQDEWRSAVMALEGSFQGGASWVRNDEIVSFAGDILFFLTEMLTRLYVFQGDLEKEAIILRVLSQQIPAKNEVEALKLLSTAPFRQDLVRRFGQLTNLDAALDNQALQMFQGLYRLAMIADKWGIGSDEMLLLMHKIPHRSGGFLNPARLLQLPQAGTVLHSDRLVNLYQLWQFHRRYAKPGYSFIALMGRLTPAPSPIYPQFISEVSQLTGWDASQLTTAISSLQNNGNYFMEIANWLNLEALFEALRKTNVDWALLRNSAAPTVTAADSQAFISRLAAQHGEKDQQNLHRDIQNHLRERKRHSLIAWLLKNNQAGWKDASDLFSHFLIDVEMSACQLTSRIVQAHGAIQMFVQRALLGLEPNVKPQDDPTSWEQWKWMKNYRIWEANRKVFLYPENWLEPELRRDKSPFFKELENALLQSNLDRDAIESAFLQYVEKLDAVANLEPMGHWYEENKDVLLVFARTSGTPHLYYYRRWMNNAYWTPWEKVEVDIPSDYLIPTVRNGQVYLYWPEFREEPEEVTSMRVPKPGAETFDVSPQRNRLLIYMAQSRLVNGKWETKKISENGINLYSDTSMISTLKGSLIFTTIKDSSNKDKESFAIYCFAGILKNTNEKVYGLGGIFSNQECGATLNAYSAGKSAELGTWTRRYFSDTEYVSMRAIEKSVRTSSNLPGDPLTIEVYGKVSTKAEIVKKTILSKTPGNFKVSESWQVNLFDKSWDFEAVDGKFPILAGGNAPWFLALEDKKFFVLPTVLLSNKVLYHKDFTKANALLSQAAKLRAQRKDGTISQQFFDAEMNSLQANIAALKDPNYAEAIYLQFLFMYHFRSFYHPLTCHFAKEINSGGISSLLNRSTQLSEKSFDFKAAYVPNESTATQLGFFYTPESGYPKEDVDFNVDGAYSSYNWELFFHAPMLIAQRLTKNQRFEEAMQWYHYIFNPLGLEPPAQLPAAQAWEDQQRYWITKPFFLRKKGAQDQVNSYLGQDINNWLRELANSPLSMNPDNERTKAVSLWRKNPFDPHTIAKFRTVAYQKGVIMKYIDNLIAWGDHLFRQDTMESINEATQLYVIAAEILGPRPRRIPAAYEAKSLSFAQLEPKIDAFSNALVGLENLMAVVQIGDPSRPIVENPPTSLSMLFFCLPPNEKLLEYWDTVGDRLYKIRHCQNIEGVERQLALFAPPIDPGALIGALAGGGTLDGALAELNAPLPLYRFQVMLQKANELCNDLKALGGALLSALEKTDGEEMARLRQGQEIQMLNLITTIKNKAVEDANNSVNNIIKSRELIQIREAYYRNKEFMNVGETIAISLNTAATLMDASTAIGYSLAGGLSLIPNFVIGASGLGSPVATAATGGESAAAAAEHGVKTISAISRTLDKSASLMNTISSYQRRKEEWDYQTNLATKELEQIEIQLQSANIKLRIAQTELANHDLQISNARAIDEYMRSKYTNQELYEWMSTQISQVYFQTYQMAFDIAKRAERCLQFELGLENTRIVQYGHWDSLKKGLMSAERLQLDLRKLDQAYLDRNKRELELTKHISLKLLNPLALLELREQGKCDFVIPEELFDLDFPGHYFRRIKSVSISIPCVAGPYTTVNATLRLKKSRIRAKANLTDSLADNFTGIQSIATSAAQNDSGLFELNFRDERYLPFEGTGAISEWTLEMMYDEEGTEKDEIKAKFLRQFDYNTIADVILHLRYTTREGGTLFRKEVMSDLKTKLNALRVASDRTGLSRLFSLRHDFPNEWHAWKKAGAEDFTLKLGNHHFPYFAQLGEISIEEYKVYKKGEYPNAVISSAEKREINADLVLSGLNDTKADDYFLVLNYIVGEPPKEQTK